jgi:hypothetical protein
MKVSLYSFDNFFQLGANFGCISFISGFSTACMDASGSMAVTPICPSESSCTMTLQGSMVPQTVVAVKKVRLSITFGVESG